MRPGDPGYHDPFRPPDIVTEVECIHCGQTFESYLIHWVPGDPADPGEGFWSCPTPGCDGIGFLFDIWPTDPDWRDEDGQPVCFFDDESDEDDGDYPEDDLLDRDESDLSAGPDDLDDEDIPF